MFRLTSLSAMCAVLVVVFLVQAAPASTIFLIDGGITGLDWKNYETLETDGNSDGKLDVGDTLRGVLQVQNTSRGIMGTHLAGYLPGNLAGNPEVTAVFEIEVLKKSAADFGLFNYVFGPTSNFATDLSLPTGSMIAFYRDPVFEYTATIDDLTKTRSDVEDIITDGTPMFAAGIGTSRLKTGAADTFGDTQAGDGYWYAMSASEDITSGSGGTANFYYGLSVLDTFGEMSSSDFDPILNGLGNLSALSTDLNMVVGKGSTNANTATTGATPGSIDKYYIASNDPMGVKVVPEPTSITILAVAGFCLAVFGVRRRRS